MDMEKRGPSPLDDEEWLAEQLKREAAIFQDPAERKPSAPARQEPPQEAAPAPEPAPDRTPRPYRVPPDRQDPLELPPDVVLEGQGPSLEEVPLPQPDQPPEPEQPAPQPVLPGLAAPGGKKYTREELRNGIRMAVILDKPKALQTERDEW
jgi:hypothetical protein